MQRCLLLPRFLRRQFLFQSFISVAFVIDNISFVYWMLTLNIMITIFFLVNQQSHFPVLCLEIKNEKVILPQRPGNIIKSSFSRKKHMKQLK